MTGFTHDEGSTSSVFGKDLAERAGSTAVQAAVAVALVEATGIAEAWAVVIAAVLAVAKGLLARYVGRKDSASLVPAVPPVA